MATGYQRGRAFEYRVRDRLLKDGAAYVMRAASSKGAADLIALWPRLPRVPSAATWLVQCKYGKGRVSPAEREELARVARETGARAFIAKPGPNGRGVEFIAVREEK